MIIKNLFQIVLISFFIVSCSSDDNKYTSSQNDNEESTNDSEEFNLLYKKSEKYTDNHITFKRSINYNDSNNDIHSIVMKRYHTSTKTITPTYSDNNITSINVIVDYESDYNSDSNVTYNVTEENDKIFLESADFIIEIYHSNGYVNSTRRFNLSNPNEFTEQVFTRDENLNLIGNNDNNGNSYEYSNFDSNKKIAPLGSVIRCAYFDFFRLFDLKLSNNNPLNGTILTSEGLIYDFVNYLEYNEQGHVIRTTKEPESTTNYISHQYIEE